MVLVWPKDDVMRKHLKHPHNNVSFREQGPIDWPDDQFTHRRLEDGDVLLNDPNPPETSASVEAAPPAAGKKK